MSKKVTKIDFINKSKKIHNNYYDYSLVDYISAKTKVKIICPVHGVFEQKPSHHRVGIGCPKCGTLIASNKTKLGKEKFVVKSKKIHDNKYDYSLVEYKNAYTKVKIICPEHGIFEQSPTSHLSGSGCPDCVGHNMNTEKFIKKAKKIHGDKYDYSLVEYKNTQTKVKIICPEHGEFLQSPNDHLTGRNCSKCVGGVKITKDEFIERAVKIHEDLFDYSKVKYVNSQTKVIIICSKHGEFKQTPGSHLSGSGCPKCIGRNKTREELISEFNKIHDNKYDYSKFGNINYDIKIPIICPNHGVFFCTINNHLRKKGCPKCIGRFKTKEELINEFQLIHNHRYDYSLIEYKNSNTKIKIICREHGTFEQDINSHRSGAGCPVCNSGWIKGYKLKILESLQSSDLLMMEPAELFTIIGQGKLPPFFLPLITTDPNSDSRIEKINELKSELSNEDENTDLVDVLNDNPNIQVIDENEEKNYEFENDRIDDDGGETEERVSEPELEETPDFNLDYLGRLDNPLYSNMDEEAINFLVSFSLVRLWNDVLNENTTTDKLKEKEGGEYFTKIKNQFLSEYETVSGYVPPIRYSFSKDKDGIITEPNLMQKLIVSRIKQNKNYGNWSGTGAGKTNSFIISSRELDSRLTVVIAVNSTINQLCEDIKDVYPDSDIFTFHGGDEEYPYIKKYKRNIVFDRNLHNYLVINYDKFQDEYKEDIFIELTDNNKIDFITVDEVHFVKQRSKDEEQESIRRRILLRFMGRSREKNPELHTLVMSATPVINNLQEAKSLLQLLTNKKYDELKVFRNVSNALKIFQLLTLNGLRYRPKYNIDIEEITGNIKDEFYNPILNIDGSHLTEQITKSINYFKVEKILLHDKLESIKSLLKPGVILYTYYTRETGIMREIEDYLKKNVKHLTFGSYTGEESTEKRNENLKNFLSGKLDILIGSRPIGTGVDNLQKICDRMIILTLPWTHSEYIQLKGRIHRQGSVFGSVQIIVPQVRIELSDGKYWSWDEQRWNLIQNKRTLSDAAVDGIIPSRCIPSPDTLYKKSIDALNDWKNRLLVNGEEYTFTREELTFPLRPEVREKLKWVCPDFVKYNNEFHNSYSKTTHERLQKHRELWFDYHDKREERIKKWRANGDEIPYEKCAELINSFSRPDDVVADLGCGVNRLKTFVSNKVLSFDHIGIDESVVECDISNIPLENNSVDMVVISQALVGLNYVDYIKESYRILKSGRICIVAEGINKWKDKNLSEELTSNGFTLIKEEKTNKIKYFILMKI